MLELKSHHSFSLVYKFIYVYMLLSLASISLYLVVFIRQMVVYPKGSSGIPGKHDLSIYLNVADTSALPSGWSRYAQFTLTVVNQVDRDKSITVGKLSTLHLVYFTFLMCSFAAVN